MPTILSQGFGRGTPAPEKDPVAKNLDILRSELRTLLEMTRRSPSEVEFSLPERFIASFLRDEADGRPAQLSAAGLKALNDIQEALARYREVKMARSSALFDQETAATREVVRCCKRCLVIATDNIARRLASRGYDEPVLDTKFVGESARALATLIDNAVQDAVLQQYRGDSRYLYRLSPLFRTALEPAALSLPALYAESALLLTAIDYEAAHRAGYDLTFWLRDEMVRSQEFSRAYPEQTADTAVRDPGVKRFLEAEAQCCKALRDAAGKLVWAAKCFGVLATEPQR